MIRTLRYHPLFDNDAIGAAQWYDKRLPDLGATFLTCVQDAIEQLVADPQRRSSADYGVRYWPVQRFPYVVFYDFTESEVLLLGVMHTSQDAEKWLVRRG